MKFKVNREKLNKALQRVGSLIGSRSIMPLLNNVLLKAENNVLYLTTSDVELRMNTSIEAEVEEAGLTTAPAKKLTSLVAGFTADTIEFDVDSEDHIKLSCGTAKYRLLGLPANDYPEEMQFTAAREIVMKEAEFKRLTASIIYAVSQDASRKALTGVFFNAAGGTLTLVATDGKRMALQEKTPESFNGADGSAIVPLKAVSESRRMLEGDGTVKISIGEKMCEFKAANFTLSSKLIEGNYPNYKQVLPNSFSQIIDLPVEPLISKIATISLMLPDASSSIVLHFENNLLKLDASSTEVGEGTDFVDIQYDGTPFDISFNPQYLMDPLRATDAEIIKFKMNDPQNPVAFEGGEGFMHIIMPIRKKQPVPAAN